MFEYQTFVYQMLVNQMFRIQTYIKPFKNVCSLNLWNIHVLKRPGLREQAGNGYLCKKNATALVPSSTGWLGGRGP